nr:nucleoside deaminase [Methylorubrum rhodinum]
MTRCLQIARSSAKRGEYPFASLIACGEKVLVEAENNVTEKGDVTQHAELVAISRALILKYGLSSLEGCTLYSSVEPCAMCSFPIRESRLSRVVYSISSPLMGGHSRWGIMTDKKISDCLPEFFADPPEILSGILRIEAMNIWKEFYPDIWKNFELANIFR